MLLIGCSTVIDVQPVSTYSINQIKTSAIGDPFFIAQTGTLQRFKHWVGIANSPDGWKIDDIYSPDYLRKELIYSGVSGSTIEVAYREFRGGLAAPAFFQNLKYDLSASKTIKFQNFTLQILTADNNTITYKVISDS